MRSGRSDKERASWRGKFAPPAKAPPMGYDALRKLYLARLRPLVAEAGRLSMPERPAFVFIWFERDRHRDPDNVRAGGTKLILDALVLGGILPADTSEIVRGFMGDEYAYGVREGVDVAAWSDDANGPAWTMAVPFRLPDLNELLAAARQDGILTERVRQARRAR